MSSHLVRLGENDVRDPSLFTSALGQQGNDATNLQCFWADPLSSKKTEMGDHHHSSKTGKNKVLVVSWVTFRLLDDFRANIFI